MKFGHGYPVACLLCEKNLTWDNFRPTLCNLASTWELLEPCAPSAFDSCAMWKGVRPPALLQPSPQMFALTWSHIKIIKHFQKADAYSCPSTPYALQLRGDDHAPRSALTWLLSTFTKDDGISVFKEYSDIASIGCTTHRILQIRKQSPNHVQCPTSCLYPTKTPVLSGKWQLPSGAIPQGLVNQLRQGAWSTAAARAHLLKRRADRGTWSASSRVSWWACSHVFIIYSFYGPSANHHQTKSKLISWRATKGHLHSQRFEIFGTVTICLPSKSLKLNQNCFLRQWKTYCDCYWVAFW